MLTPATVDRDEYWLVEDSTGHLVNVANRKFRHLGIWSVRVRGDRYATGKVRVGPASLVRVPDHPDDPNAVSIRVDGKHIGYFNKAMAPGVAPEFGHVERFLGPAVV